MPSFIFFPKYYFNQFHTLKKDPISHLLPKLSFGQIEFANFPLNASECLIPSFPIQVSQKLLFIDGVYSHVHFMSFVQETTEKATIPTFS